jgi:hypothetical protein
MVGAAIGGSTGLYNGLRRSVLAGESGKLRRTQVRKYVMKCYLTNYYYATCFLLAPLIDDDFDGAKLF